jgi:hypothetical protein
VCLTFPFGAAHSNDPHVPRRERQFEATYNLTDLYRTQDEWKLLFARRPQQAEGRTSFGRESIRK